MSESTRRTVCVRVLALAAAAEDGMTVQAVQQGTGAPPVMASYHHDTCQNTDMRLSLIIHCNTATHNTGLTHCVQSDVNYTPVMFHDWIWYSSDGTALTRQLLMYSKPPLLQDHIQPR